MNYNRRYLVPIILVFLFASPGIAAYVFYHHPQWLAGTKLNHGILLQPPIAIKNAPHPSKWQLVLWAPSVCDKTCEHQLEALARIRLALGRRLYEVNVQLLLGPQAEALSSNLISKLKDHDILIARLNESHSQSGANLPHYSQLYIENPTGYLVLAYSSQTKPEPIHKDLKHLLNVKE
ncbi:hypothetical protein [Legionella impletisoli]|uniref:Transmembrane protein n=1 Tax=Legionella impletisoli TaxID=343510 RepID=A0A917JXM6_9GAMM|nr:hypothetical protein [Legionella impletisoli]GGI90169.1 hypothetical protein GCM10007966_18700 [Legionella impletisoli]